MNKRKWVTATIKTSHETHGELITYSETTVTSVINLSLICVYVISVFLLSIKCERGVMGSFGSLIREQNCPPLRLLVLLKLIPVPPIDKMSGVCIFPFCSR